MTTGKPKKTPAPRKADVSLTAKTPVSRTRKSPPAAAEIVTHPIYLVGIGASAGGLEALSNLIAALPTNLGLAYAVIQHLSPTHRSMMAQLLGR